MIWLRREPDRVVHLPVGAGLLGLGSLVGLVVEVRDSPWAFATFGIVGGLMCGAAVLGFNRCHRDGDWLRWGRLRLDHRRRAQRCRLLPVARRSRRTRVIALYLVDGGTELCEVASFGMNRFGLRGCHRVAEHLGLELLDAELREHF